MGNPLLNLATALGQTPQTANVGGTFAVKKRWDDGTPPAFNTGFCRLTALLLLRSCLQESGSSSAQATHTLCQ